MLLTFGRKRISVKQTRILKLQLQATPLLHYNISFPDPASHVYSEELQSSNWVQDTIRFRKSILSIDLLEKLEEKDKLGSRKGAWFYRFDEKKFMDLNTNGVLIKMSL
jgi:hypothetical protein